MLANGITRNRYCVFDKRKICDITGSEPMSKSFEWVKARASNPNVSGLADYQLFIDGKKSDGKNVELIPGSHVFDIKYLSKEGRQEKVKVNLSGVSEESILLSTGAKRLFSMKEVLEGERLSGVSLSHDGRFLITRYSEILPGGTTSWKYQLTEWKTGRIVRSLQRPFVGCLLPIVIILRKRARKAGE
jgi:hypothetical protein